MKKVTIKLNSIEKVKEFVNLATHYSGELELSSGRYMVDAKSIMGIFSLNLNNELILVMESGEDLPEFMCGLQPYLTS